VADLPDRLLLARCRAGDPVAWDAIVERYQRLVFTVALRNGLEREDAADITQATFVALLGSIDSLRDEDRLASWLMAVTRRQAWRLATARKREESVDLDSVSEVAAPVDEVASWELAATIQQAVAALGNPCSQVLHWLYLDAATPSYAEIAERLDRSAAGIGPLRARCMERIRRVLGEDFDVEARG